MKLKGLSKLIKDIEAMQEVVTDKIDDLYDEPPQWEEKDNFYNDVYMNLDSALELLRDVESMKMEDYL